MRIRNVLVCSADFPVDVIGDDGQEGFRPNGFAATKVIGEILLNYGMDVKTPTADLEHHAWDVFVNWKGRKFWLLVSVINPEIIFYAQDHTPIFPLFRKKEIFFLDFLRKLHKILADDIRFNNFLWYKTYDAAHKGHLTPTD